MNDRYQMHGREGSRVTGDTVITWSITDTSNGETVHLIRASEECAKWLDKMINGYTRDRENKARAGRLGGKARTARKVQTSQDNGALGGRPEKVEE